MKKLKRILSTSIALTIAATSLTTAFAADKFVYYRVGDFDENKTVDVSDVTTLQMQLAGYDVMQGGTLDMADFNGDGDFDVVDVTEAQKMLVGLDYNCFLTESKTYLEYNFARRDDYIAEDNPNKINYETLYDCNNLIFTNYYCSELGGNSYLIKNKDEFFSVFNVYSPIFNDEFFEENALYVILEFNNSYVTDYDVTAMAVEGNTLYIDKKYVYPNPVGAMPTAWHVIYKIKKSDIQNVDTISSKTNVIYENLYG